jgi:DNA-3-methyladenine glycosylase I
MMEAQMNRCCWAKEDDKLMLDYHDNEYGRRKKGDTALFEKLCLECFQAGLSWRTVLYKRDAFRDAFSGFDLIKVAAMTPEDIDRLMQDARLIRNRLKISAVIENARLTIKLIEETGSLEDYMYSFRSGADLSAALKKRGFKFVGGTICESYLLSIGAIEAHEPECFCHGQYENI